MSKAKLYLGLKMPTSTQDLVSTLGQHGFKGLELLFKICYRLPTTTFSLVSVQMFYLLYIFRIWNTIRALNNF